MIRVKSATWCVAIDTLQLHLEDGTTRPVYGSAHVTADGKAIDIEDAEAWLAEHGPADARITEDALGNVLTLALAEPMEEGEI